MSAPAVALPPAAPRSLLAGSAGRALGVLALINLFNYLDRFVVSALVEGLKRSELALSDAQAGLLMTGFVVVYMLASPVFGVLGDRGSRPRLVALGVLVWSLATALAGFAGGFASLFLARAVVGIGEAAYGTISPSLIARFVGTFAGGWLGDRLLRRSAQAYLWLSGISALLAAPLAWLVFTDARPAVYLPAMVVAELLIFASTGPINSVIVNVVKPGERATAVALSILSIHLLGDVPSPPLIGRLSDVSSLGRAVLIVPIAVLVAGVIWTLEAWLGGRRRPPALDAGGPRP